MEVSNYELFENFYDSIRDGASKKEVMKNYGGSNLYVPSFKTAYRNDEIRDKYTELTNQGATRVIRTLSKEYELSEAQVYAITKDLRQEVDMTT